jgi:hypothetical protein
MERISCQTNKSKKTKPEKIKALFSGIENARDNGLATELEEMRKEIVQISPRGLDLST